MPDHGGDATIRLLVRADDFGSTHSANLACIQCHQRGIVRSAEVMVTCPWFEEAARLANEHPALDIGVHLVLTSEWSGYRWRPLTSCPSITDDAGFFPSMIFPTPGIPSEQTLLERAWNIRELEDELRAQIELALRRIPYVSHLTGHMGWELAHPELGALFERLAAAYGFRANVDAEPITYMGTYDKSGSIDDQAASFVDALRRLAPGTWLFLEHPAYEDTEEDGLSHVAYVGVAKDRGDVTRVLMHPAVRGAIADTGIELIGYHQLRCGPPRRRSSTPQRL